MITEKQKQSIIKIIFNMKDGEIQWLKDYFPEEKEYIIQLMESQKGIYNWILESNGTAKDKTTITKFRKRFIR